MKRWRRLCGPSMKPQTKIWERGGPDFVREIYPTVFTMDADGVREQTQDDVAAYYRAFVAGLRKKE